MSGHAQHQAANIAPPRRGAVIALGVDTTARPYDISALALGGYTPHNANNRQEYVFLTLQADGGDVYFHFASATASDLDNAAAIAAGGAIAFANTYGAKIPVNTEQTLRIDRTQDKFLIIETASGTATLRFWASSEGF